MLLMKIQKHAKHTKVLNGVERIGSKLVQVVRGEKSDSIDAVKCTIT